MNLRMLQPEVLVSINDCEELTWIRDEGTSFSIGAGARQWDVETHPDIITHCPSLASALGYVGGRSNRNRGTVCGSLAHSDTLAELPVVAAALGARLTINGPSGRREVSPAEFFLGPLETCLEPDEMLEFVTFPKRAASEFSHFSEIGVRKHGFAVSGVCANLTIGEDKKCVAARIAVMGAMTVAARATEVEQFLDGAELQPQTIVDAGRLLSESLEMASDIHADSEGRASLAGELLCRSLAVIEKVASERMAEIGR